MARDDDAHEVSLLTYKLMALYPARVRTLQERLDPEMLNVIAEVSKNINHRWTPAGMFGLPVQPVGKQDVQDSKAATLQNWLKDLAAERDWSKAPRTPPTKEALLQAPPAEEITRRSEIGSKMCHRWDFCKEFTDPEFDWEWAQERASFERNHLQEALQAKLDSIYDKREQSFKSLEYNWKKAETARQDHNDDVRLGLSPTRR